MRKRSTRRSLPEDTTAMLGRTGERLAEQHGVSVSEIRYAQFTYHDGNRWTIRTTWEIRRGDRWEDIDIPTTAATPGGMAYEESLKHLR